MSQATPAGTTPLTTGPARPTWVRWQVVALLVSYSFMTWFNRVSMSVAYDERIKAQYDIPPEQIGWVYSAFLFAYMIFMTPGGWAIDRLGPWLALVVMGFGSALFGALTASVGSQALATTGIVLLLLVVIRSAMGALTAPVYPASARVVAHWLPTVQRARANGLVQGAAAVGIACTFPVFGALIDWFDWPAAFCISAAGTALLAVAWTLCGASYPAQHRRVNAAEVRWIDGQPDMVAGPEHGVIAVSTALAPAAVEPARRPWLGRNRSLLLLTLSYAAVGYVEYLFFFWMHYYFEKVLHLGQSQSRVYAGLLTLAMAAGMVLGGWVADRVRMHYPGRRSCAVVPVSGMLVGGLFLVLGVLVQDTALIVTLLAVALAAIGATEAPIWTMATELGGRRGGTAAAICNTGGNAGGLLAPIVTPAVSSLVSRYADVSESAGWQVSISVGSVIAVAGAVLWLWITSDRD